MKYNPPMTKTPHDHNHTDHSHDGHHHDHQHQQSDLIGPNTTLDITIPWSEAKKAYDSVLKKLAKGLKVDGFRKGKTPAHIAEQHLGPVKVIEKSLDELLPQHYVDAVKAAKKQPITQPDFEPKAIKMGEDWRIEATFAELPEVKLGKYQAIVQKAKKAAEKVISETEKTQKKTSKTAKDSKNKEENLTENQKKESTLHQVFKSLAEEIKPKIPEMLLQQETRREFDQLVQNLGQMNLKAEEYLEKRGMTIEQLSNELAAAALGRLQIDLILGEIAKQEKFSAEKSDISDYIAKIEDERTRKLLEGNPTYQNQLETTIIRQKVIDHLLNM